MRGSNDEAPAVGPAGASATHGSVADDVNNSAPAEIEQSLDRLYPATWALLLTPLCEPEQHRHGRETCAHPGKRPLGRQWQREAVARWRAGSGRPKHVSSMAQHLASGRNVGLVVPPGVVVLDCDTPASVCALEALLDDAPMQRTGKGAHFVARVPAGAEIKATVKVKLADGVEVDVRSAGRSQIVVEPSIHATGAAYSWVSELPERVEDLPACPDAILEEIVLTPAPTANATPKSDGDAILEGARNATLASLAGTMRRRGAGEPAILAALREENTRRCRPPLPESEVAAIAASVSRYEPAHGEERDGPYAIEGGRIVHRRLTREGVTRVPLANFAAAIVAEEIRDDGAEQTAHLRLSGRLASGRPLREVAISAREFSAMTWPLAAWGAEAIPAPGQGARDHLRAAIQMLSTEIARTTTYTHTGWRRIGERWCYLHGAGAIGAGGPVLGVAVDLAGALAEYILPDPPEGEALAAALRASVSLLAVAPERISAPLHAAVVRAVIDSADFALHVSGPTGVLKTALCAVVQQHYGASMDAAHLPGSWTSTANALEGAAFTAKDALFVVDDFAPRGSSADVQRFHRDADRLLRAQGNRAGRARMRADGTLRPAKPPRGLVLSTGEDIPSGHSIRARCLVVEVAPGEIDGQRLAGLQGLGAQGALAAALSGFVRWLAPRLDEVRAELRAKALAWRERSFAHRRTSDMIGSLAAAHAIWRRYVVDAAALLPEESAALGERVERGLLEAAEAQTEIQRGEDPVLRFFSLLAGALAAGEAHLASARDSAEPPGDAGRWGWRALRVPGRPGCPDSDDLRWTSLGSRIGWVDEDAGDVFLEPEAVYRTVQRFADAQREGLAVGQRTLWRRLAERGLLASSDRDHATVKVDVGGQRRRVLHLRTGTLSSPRSGAIGANGAEERGERAERSGADLRPDPRPDPPRSGARIGAENGAEAAARGALDAPAPFAPIAPIGGVETGIRSAEPEEPAGWWAEGPPPDVETGAGKTPSTGEWGADL